MNLNVHAAISAFIRTVLLFFFTAGSVYAQFSIGAAQVAMGHTGTAIKNSYWAVFNNPAWVSTEKTALSFFAHRFTGIPELTDIAISFSTPLPFGTAGAGIHRFGYDLYSEQQISLAYKQELDAVHTAILLSYHHISIGGGYGSAGAPGILLGIGIEFSHKLHVGIRTDYLNRPTIGNSGERISHATSAGFRYSVSETAYITGDIVKDPDFPVSGRAGFELLLGNTLYLRSGVTARPSTYSFGFGYAPSALMVNLGIQQNDLLGLSAAMDITIPM